MNSIHFLFIQHLLHSAIQILKLVFIRMKFPTEEEVLMITPLNYRDLFLNQSVIRQKDY